MRATQENFLHSPFFLPFFQKDRTSPVKGEEKEKAFLFFSYRPLTKAPCEKKEGARSAIYGISFAKKERKEAQEREKEKGDKNDHHKENAGSHHRRQRGS